MIVRARACSLYKCVCLRFLMNLEVEETPRGILMRPLSMLWFVPDGCVKYWCDHGALRDYRLCHTSAASTVLRKKYFECKWVFYTLLIYFNSQNCCCCCWYPKQPGAVFTGAEFLFGAAAAFPPYCNYGRLRAEISGFAPEILKCNFFS